MQEAASCAKVSSSEAMQALMDRQWRLSHASDTLPLHFAAHACNA